MLYYFAFNKRPLKTKYSVRRAEPDDVGAMQAFFNREAPKKQFYPHYDFVRVGTDDPYYRDIKLEDYFLAFDGDELVGITGAWDQKGFKQTRFVGYHWIIRALRPFYNAGAKVVGGFYLPQAGHTVSYVTLHTILTKDNDPDIFSALLRTVYRTFRGQRDKTLIFGLMQDDPLKEALKGYRKQTLPGRHFLITHGQDPRAGLDPSRVMYLECARL